MSASQRESTMEFGSYWYTDTEKKPIEWIIIDSKGDKKLLLSKYVLELKEFNRVRLKPITWAECSLRLWLNQEFYELAFNEAERERICTVKNKTLPSYGCGVTIDGGKATEDKLFLLSKEEFNSLDDNIKLAKATPRATRTLYNGEVMENGWWWLRSVSSSKPCIMYSSDGKATGGISAGNDFIGVRPAMWVNFGKEKYEYIREEIEYMELGSYYQSSSEVKEPIKWRVLKKEGDRALLISCKILEGQAFNTAESATWEGSYMRKYLNGEFLNTAFNDEERKRLKSEIMLLSIDEMIELFDSNEDRISYEITDEAKKKGIQFLSIGKSFVWLRPNEETSNPPMMNCEGALAFQGLGASIPLGIMPAVWVSLK